MTGTPATMPEELTALEPVEIGLATGKVVPVRRWRARFNPSPERSGMGLDRTYAAKPLVLVDKQAVFPEIACLSLFQHNGWTGVWADAHHRKYFDKMPMQSKGTSLDAYANQAVSRIASNNGQSKAGCWDLILWENRTLVFVAVTDDEDADLDDARIRWLAAAVRSGLSPSQFWLVSWGYRTVAARRKVRHGA
jgi:hypothetical protein